MSRVKVECYSGYKGDQEPRVVWLEDGPHEVAAIGASWREPECDVFRVRTSDGLRLVLRHDRTSDEWSLDRRETTDG